MGTATMNLGSQAFYRWLCDRVHYPKKYEIISDFQTDPNIEINPTKSTSQGRKHRKKETSKRTAKRKIHYKAKEQLRH
jgi:hypothetical protein